MKLYLILIAAFFALILIMLVAATLLPVIMALIIGMSFKPLLTLLKRFIYVRNS